MTNTFNVSGMESSHARRVLKSKGLTSGFGSEIVSSLLELFEVKHFCVVIENNTFMLRLFRSSRHVFTYSKSYLENLKSVK